MTPPSIAGPERTWHAPLVDALLAMADDARLMLRRASKSLTGNDLVGAGQVLTADDAVDAARTSVQVRIVELLAERHMAIGEIHAAFALAQVAGHLERVADYAVEVAAMVSRVHELPQDPLLHEDFTRMALVVDSMWDLAIEALRTADLRHVDRLVELQHHNRSINQLCVKKLLDIGADSQLREWGLRMMLVSRCFERAGDHLIDVVEQVAYLVTGTPQQFMDASQEALGQWPDPLE